MKRKLGRPPKLTPEVVRIIRLMWARHQSRSATAAACGISTSLVSVARRRIKKEIAP